MNRQKVKSKKQPERAALRDSKDSKFQKLPLNHEFQCSSFSASCTSIAI